MNLTRVSTTRQTDMTIDFWRVENANGTDFRSIIVHKNDELFYSSTERKHGTLLGAYHRCMSVVERHMTPRDNITINVTIS